ncbi:MAG: hypothetical protein IKC54_02810 [Clostridia bacterium]|nr:hypothetical protein [Clostridia bacterium]
MTARLKKNYGNNSGLKAMATDKMVNAEKLSQDIDGASLDSAGLGFSYNSSNNVELSNTVELTASNSNLALVFAFGGGPQATWDDGAVMTVSSISLTFDITLDDEIADSESTFIKDNEAPVVKVIDAEPFRPDATNGGGWNYYPSRLVPLTSEERKAYNEKTLKEKVFVEESIDNFVEYTGLLLDSDTTYYKEVCLAENFDASGKRLEGDKDITQKIEDEILDLYQANADHADKRGNAYHLSYVNAKTEGRSVDGKTYYKSVTSVYTDTYGYGRKKDDGSKNVTTATSETK